MLDGSCYFTLVVREVYISKLTFLAETELGIKCRVHLEYKLLRDGMDMMKC